MRDAGEEAADWISETLVDKWSDAEILINYSRKRDENIFVLELERKSTKANLATGEETN